MGKLIWYLLTILATSCVCDAYKILVAFPMPGKSHGILGDGYVRYLLEAGHEVTYITPFPKKNQTNPKLREIDVSDNLKIFPEEFLDIKRILNKEVDINDFGLMLTMFNKLTESSFNSEGIIKLLNDPNEQFDVLIAEWMFSETFSGLSAVYDCPLIWSSSSEPHWMVLSLIDEATNPAYTSDIMSSNIPPMSFYNRVSQLFLYLLSLSFRELYVTPAEKSHYENIFVPILTKKGRPVPTYDELRYNASIMLGNSHPSMGEASRLPQNYKSIGGYHVDTNVKPLPEDLKKIMDNAKDGVIYFSMGSNLRSKFFPDELKRDILKVFGGLKQTVLWKFEEELPNLPKNVHILSWAPQLSILSHPNCRLFITHGGLLSTTETIHFGVPIIGIPVFADQFINVERAVQKGFAKKVSLSYDMADELKAAIEDILSNPKYRERVKELSMIYHDRPVSPGKELVHWVEHVVRTRGAPHLRSPALHVPWYQKAYLDLAAVILAVLVVLKVVIKRLFCKSKKIDKGKKRN